MSTAALAVASRYKAVQVTTCSPGDLLVMLYDGLFRFLTEAEGALEDGDKIRFRERVSRSQAIVEQLLVGLDARIAPELCARLEALYTFAMENLTKANIAADASPLREVQRALSPLRDAWKQAVQATK